MYAWLLRTQGDIICQNGLNTHTAAYLTGGERRKGTGRTSHHGLACWFLKVTRRSVNQIRK